MNRHRHLRNFFPGKSSRYTEDDQRINGAAKDRL